MKFFSKRLQIGSGRVGFFPNAGFEFPQHDLSTLVGNTNNNNNMKTHTRKNKQIFVLDSCARNTHKHHNICFQSR